MVDEHNQKFTHSYTVHYHDHEPREGDKHYTDFNAYKRKLKKDPELYKCAVGNHRDDYSECSLDKPLELHHHFVEYALANGVDLKWLEVDFPGISNPDEVGAWIESPANLLLLCERHHRGADGVHVLSAADYEAMKYVRDLIVKSDDKK